MILQAKIVAHISHKLKNAFEGALAGGGDPATSPLYVFGPFLKLIVVAGVAKVTFGATIWLVILTIVAVSAVYRLVMRWVTDGSGGSGLSEEEFGTWAVRIDAAITFIEYTLTFLVSMSAMVTFIADRFPSLNQRFLWFEYRTIVAILLSILVGWLVNRGPKIAVYVFGPATAGVLLLLWTMVFTTLYKYGLHLPDFNLAAFNSEHITFTLGGYARILAVMTGIEVFANLVPAFEGNSTESSRKSFNSLLIIMGTTGITMLVVGPAIFQLSDPTHPEISVFTQTMDQLLPAPLPWLGTLVGVAVLMSASAASAQGLQNLALGLTRRCYIPPMLGRLNTFKVADKPVWLEVGMVSICFVIFGTREETYLAIYAAGVFILLSIVSWAVTKRLIRQVQEQFSYGKVGLIVGTTLAAVLTTTATIIIFRERFLDGAWVYFVLIPTIFAFFTYSRQRLGTPDAAIDYLGRFNAGQLAGFGFGQTNGGSSSALTNSCDFAWQPEPIEKSLWREQRIEIQKVALLLDGSRYAALAIPYAQAICQATHAHLTLLSSVKNHTQALRDDYEDTKYYRQMYLNGVAAELEERGIIVETEVRAGFLADATESLVAEKLVDLVITSTRGKSGNPHWLSGGVSSKLMSKITTPVLLVQTGDDINNARPKLSRILVSLDGSIHSECVLPFARAFANAFNSELILLTVPQVPEIEDYRAPISSVRMIRENTVIAMEDFLAAVARSFRSDGIQVSYLVKGSLPARTIVSVGDEMQVDMILMTSRGRGGMARLFLGSVAERVVEHTPRAVLMIPVHESMKLPFSQT